MQVSRRGLLGAGGLGLAALSFPNGAFGQAADSYRRFVLIILRGGLDGLALMPALGDPAFETARAGLAPPTSGEQAALPLDGLFGLHAQLRGVHGLYQAGQVLGVHACGTAYQDRSHFDAQNVLEIGLWAPHGRHEGWLNAALGALPAGGRREMGIAVGSPAPLALRGGASVTAWSPSRLEAPPEDTLARLQGLYEARDPALAHALASGQQASMMAAEAGGMAGEGGRQGRAFMPLAQAAGTFLRADDGPVAAVLEMGGWDTHYNQNGPAGALARNLRSLDEGIMALREALGPIWATTVVAVVTEFGRTVAMNGSGGSDHGRGGAALLIGGTVAGGRVLTDWPGLGQGQLDEGRDLRVTTQLNAVLAGVMGDHLGVSTQSLATRVFPDGGTIRPVSGLIRA
jgi:uncharacterized protein (DUF1501 family)